MKGSDKVTVGRGRKINLEEVLEEAKAGQVLQSTVESRGLAWTSSRWTGIAVCNLHW